MKVRLAYVIHEEKGVLEGGIEGFNTKKAAQMYDRWLKKVYGESLVDSTIIYDEDVKGVTY